jgi:hypothetical protein
MRSTALAATALAGGTVLAVALARRRPRLPALAPVDVTLAPAGARRLADLLEAGDPVTTALAAKGAALLDIQPGLDALLARFADPDHLAPWPCEPLPEGIGALGDWLMSGDWNSPLDVLQALREQAPVRQAADLLRDLQTDLRSAGHYGLAAQLRDAERLLERAAKAIGEADPAAVGTQHEAHRSGGDGDLAVRQPASHDI